MWMCYCKQWKQATWEKSIVAFANFLQTTKVFPTNFISAILSANGYYAEIYFSFLSKAKLLKFSLHYDDIQWITKLSPT